MRWPSHAHTEEGRAPRCFRHGRRRFATVLALLLLLVGPAAPGQEATEYELKAAFLYNFAGYVEWPAETFGGPETPLVFAVAGSEELAGNLELMMAGRTVNGRAARVRRLAGGDSLAGVHVLFAGGVVSAPAASLLQAALAQSILTVTEAVARPRDSVINFEIVDGRVRFDVSLDAARRADLQVSSRLLQVALRVTGATQ